MLRQVLPQHSNMAHNAATCFHSSRAAPAPDYDPTCSPCKLAVPHPPTPSLPGTPAQGRRLPLRRPLRHRRGGRQREQAGPGERGVAAGAAPCFASASDHWGSLVVPSCFSRHARRMPWFRWPPPCPCGSPWVLQSQPSAAAAADMLAPCAAMPPGCPPTVCLRLRTALPCAAQVTGKAGSPAEAPVAEPPAVDVSRAALHPSPLA